MFLLSQTFHVNVGICICSMGNHPRIYTGSEITTTSQRVTTAMELTCKIYSILESYQKSVEQLYGVSTINTTYFFNRT